MSAGLEVGTPAPRVVQAAEPLAGEAERHGVDREVAAREVLVQGSGLDLGQ